MEIKIVDPETGAIVPRGAPGELCTRGYSVMLGYWDNDGGDARRRSTRAGWMHTGDLATMDDDGYVNIVGRIKDMIIRGGENIYPREIEEFLHTHPAVQRCAGHRRAEREVRRGGDGLGEAAAGVDADRRGVCVAFCRGRIATFKIPRLLEVRRRVPDDGDRQGAEVPDARGGDRRARPAARGTAAYRVRKAGLERPTLLVTRGLIAFQQALARPVDIALKHEEIVRIPHRVSEVVLLSASDLHLQVLVQVIRPRSLRCWLVVR